MAVCLPERHENYLCCHECDLIGIPLALCRRTALTCAPPVRWKAQWGFSLENLLKGLLIAHKDDVLQVDGMKVRPMWTGKQGHDLYWLAEQVNLDLDEEERHLLTRMSLVTRWGGRYPLPFELEEIRPTPVSDAEEVGPRGWSSRHGQVFSLLYDRLCARLSDLARQHSQGRRDREEEERRGQYGPTLKRLYATCQSLEQDDGTVHFVGDADPPNETTSSVSCVGCHSQFSLGRQVKGVLCGCETLHVASYRYDPARDGLIIHSDSIKKPPESS